MKGLGFFGGKFSFSRAGKRKDKQSFSKEGRSLYRKSAGELWDVQLGKLLKKGNQEGRKRSNRQNRLLSSRDHFSQGRVLLERNFRLFTERRRSSGIL